MNQNATWEKGVSLYSHLLPRQKEYPQNKFWSASIMLFKYTYSFSYTHISPENMNMNVYWCHMTWRNVFCVTEDVSFWIGYKQLLDKCTAGMIRTLKRCPVFLRQWFRHFLFHWVLTWDSADHVSFAMEKTLCIYRAALWSSRTSSDSMEVGHRLLRYKKTGNRKVMEKSGVEFVTTEA